MCGDLKAGAKLKMEGIKEKGCACKQSSKIRRWKKNGCKERGQIQCDWSTVQANDLRHGILDGVWHRKETPAQSPKSAFFKEKGHCLYPH